MAKTARRALARTAILAICAGLVGFSAVAQVKGQGQQKRSAAEQPSEPHVQQVQPGAQKGKKGRAQTQCVFEDVKSANAALEVDFYSPNCVSPGTTLFAYVGQSNFSEIWEIDFTGRIVWKLAATSVVGVPKDSYVMDVEKLPSGNILFNTKEHGAFEVTRDGAVVWKHMDSGISHDVDRLPNGNTIFARGWVPKGNDMVREVDPSGKLVWSWNGKAHYDKPPYAGIEDEGWMHVNGVTRLASGHTVISIRNFDRTIHVDRSGSVVHEAAYGTERSAERKKAKGGDASGVMRPHDPEVLANGNILAPLPPRNRVIEVTKDGEPVGTVGQWDVASDYHHIRDANRLPNGNTLLVGYYRIFEVNPAGTIVWSIRKKSFAPMTRGTTRIREVQGFDWFKAQRIAPDGTAYGG